MGIPRLDFLQFLFNEGRGIRPNQIAWADADQEFIDLVNSIVQSGGANADIRVRVALSPTTTIDASTFGQGSSTFSESDVIRVRGGGQPRYLVFWQPDTYDEITVIRQESASQNRIGEFEDPLALTVGGVLGTYRRSTDQIPAADQAQNWVVSSEDTPVATAPFFNVGWVRVAGVGFDLDEAAALAVTIAQTDFDEASRVDGFGPNTYPDAHFTVNSALGWGFFWIAVRDGLGEPPGGIAINGNPQGTGLLPNDTTGITDPDTGSDLEFYIWPAAQNISLYSGGGSTISLLGYPD